MAKHFFRRLLPDPERVARSRLMQRLGPWAIDQRLWYVNRRTIARGLAIGVFFGLLLPTAQMPLAVVVSIFLRGNLAAAIAGTLVSNPITFLPIYLVAYRLGATILQTPADERWTAALHADAHGLMEHMQSWWAAVTAAGPPLAMGLVVLACITAILVYALVDIVWRTSARSRYRRRSAARPPRQN